MRISRKKVFEYLSRCQDEKGGYTGHDIAELAKLLLVSRKALKKRIDGWTLTDPSFTGLKYLGTSLIPITLEDISLIYDRLKRNPLEIKQDILADVDRLRFERGLMPIPKTTFYRIAEQYLKSISSSREELLWLDAMHVGVRDAYNLKEARKSLSHTFTYSGLKTFAGVDLESIQRRLEEAKKWFSQTYENADLRMWYFNSRQRNKILRNHLSSIKSDENSAIQARLIFEAQVAFLVDCKDLLIEELIHKGGRIQQKMNESRKRVENEILKKWIEQYSVISDIRAVSSMLIPVFSSNFRSTDSEAMNIADIINHAYDLIGNDLKFCAGNSHTVSRVAAGMAFVYRKVILIGRNPYPPINLVRFAFGD